MSKPTKPVSARPAFVPIAPYYDELMRSVPYGMWVSYYLLLLSQQEVRPRTLLDVCCGTGTMCEMLAAEGYELAGFDISEPMIQVARRKAARKGLDIQYWVRDASNFNLGRQFDAAYSFYDSLNNITEPSCLQRAFCSVAAHLPPGGSWVFDMNTAFAFEHRMFDQQDLKPKTKLKYKWVGDWDSASRIISVRMQFWRNGNEFEETHLQRAYDPEEVELMLEKAGFEQVRAYHSYTLEPPRKRSDRLHYTAIRG